MIARPAYLTERPIQDGTRPVDPLSDVLHSLRLTGGLFLEAAFTAPFSVKTKVLPEAWQPFLAAPTQVIAYHVILEGTVLVSVDGQPPCEVHAGEIVLLPRNEGHTLASGIGLKTVTGLSLLETAEKRDLLHIAYGGGGKTTRMVCGFLGSEDLNNPLLQTLPRILKVDVREGSSYDWIEASVRFAATELANGKLTTSSVISRLSETLLVEAVRHYASAPTDSQMGWLKGLSDPYVGRALAIIHQDVMTPWSADTLAREVALSRSAFMERFSSLVGMPPFRYLTLWRLQTAKLQLREFEQIDQADRARGRL